MKSYSKTHQLTWSLATMAPRTAESFSSIFNSSLSHFLPHSLYSSICNVWDCCVSLSPHRIWAWHTTRFGRECWGKIIPPSHKTKSINVALPFGDRCFSFCLECFCFPSTLLSLVSLICDLSLVLYSFGIKMENLDDWYLWSPIMIYFLVSVLYHFRAERKTLRFCDLVIFRQTHLCHCAQYRVTIQVVPNLPLTSKQKMNFST